MPIDQINARFCVLFGTSVSQGILIAKYPPLPDFLKAVNDSSQSRIDLVIDGLDEAITDDRVDIADLLISFRPRGLLVVATQQAGAFRAFTNRIEIGGPTPEDDADAMELFTKFKKRIPRLDDERWRSGLIRKTKGHLWILTDFLRTQSRARRGLA